MTLEPTLTKENFWNEMFQQYPQATKLFCDWIDRYKRAVNWDSLFNANINFQPKGTAHEEITVAPKYHDLPYGLQAGIWIEFAQEIMNQYYEQPEYAYDFDLRENITTVLSDIEDVLTHI